MTFAISITWVIGWALGVVVVALVAALVIAITALARRIESQAVAITLALNGARENTDPLWEVKSTNHALDRVTRGLRRVRTGSET